MKLAIIGAGPAGLASLKYATEEGHTCDVFEQTGNVGGTWIYTDRTDTDEYGVPIHSAMYKGMMTNLPKETMTFLDFPFPKQPKSYIEQPKVVEYLNSFADAFDLHRQIMYYKRVIKVQPQANQKWLITIQDVKTKLDETKEYDVVIICTGHYNSPRIPKIEGHNVFKGLHLHSHKYRKPDPFINKKVLVIGGGPSGRDIAVLIAKVAEHVYVSCRGELYINFPPNLTKKVEVKLFFENGALFADGTHEEFDCIIYCTGYNYAFPFLSKDCGITIEDNWIRPLYKHIVNVEHPSMYFIGIPFGCCVIPMFDIQVRFALAFIGGNIELPSKEIMLQELEQYMKERNERSIPQRHAHKLGGAEEQKNYFDDLSTTAKIRQIPPVIHKIYASFKKIRDVTECFKILDEENFLKFECC